MKGITFGNYHSYDAFQLILAAKSIGTPSPKDGNVYSPDAYPSVWEAVE